MKKSAKTFILCVHAHQPIGNFDGIMRQAAARCYRPFFEVLDAHPRVQAVCHFSGSLIDWLEKNEPELIELLSRMASRGQIEFLGGGYYEPIFGAIPQDDLVGQIRMMKRKIQGLYGVEPTGAWLTERVWDPHLVKPLAEAGVEYTVLDDFHFEHAGVDGPVTGLYQTGEGSEAIGLFASMKELRYLMPFRKPEETLSFIHSLSGGPEEAVVFADDVEKFGFWPGTHQWIYQERWLDRFFSLLESDPALRVTTFSEFRAGHSPKKTVTIPHASYGEMMRWSGGRFYNFFDKYEESGYMRDRMWQVSLAVSSAVATNGTAEKVAQARESLYRAQCNCAYWHGVFGGLYLHHLRSAVYSNLIEAERLLSAAAHSENGSKAHRLSLTSGDRVCLYPGDAKAIFNPAYGAALEEFDFFPVSANLMCNVRRRKEPYHDAILNGKSLSKEAIGFHTLLGRRQKDLKRHLHYDSIRRLSFMDHFFDDEVDAESLRRRAYRELGDFVGEPFESVVSDRELRFTRKGRLAGAGLFSVEKTVHATSDGALKVDYGLVNEASNAVQFTFAVEFNLSAGVTHAEESFRKTGDSLSLHDTWHGVDLRWKCSDEMNFTGVSVETVSESEAGLEKTVQGICVMAQKRFDLKPGGRASMSIEFSARQTGACS